MSYRAGPTLGRGRNVPPVRQIARWTEDGRQETACRSKYPKHDAPVGGTELSDAQIAVYRYAVRHGFVDQHAAIPGPGMHAADVAKACEDLKRLRLLSCEESPATLVPVHPEIARGLLNETLASQIRSAQRTIDANNRLLQQVADVLQEPAACAGSIEDVSVITDPEQARPQIDAIALHCEAEVVSAYAGAQTDAERLAKAADGDVVLLQRGVTRRMLYQHICRTSLGMRTVVKKLASHGGLVRTTSGGFEPMSIFDRKTAVVPFESADGRAAGTVVITHRAIVCYLYRSFERLWSSAVPFEDCDAVHDNRAATENRVLLLRLMASGLKDEAIAHRLGIATRTCRRHMSALMEELGATSRFQAGLQIAQLGIVPPEACLASRAGGWADAHPLS